jgi:hypothetical protein
MEHIKTSKNDVEIARIKYGTRVKLALISLAGTIILTLITGSIKPTVLKYLQPYLLEYGKNQQSGFENPERSTIDTLERTVFNNGVRSHR